MSPNDQPTTNNSSPMIKVRSLVKNIGAQEILRGVDLEVPRGETLAIIGRSGGGKSVLLKHLIGLMKPDAGEIWIEGQNITGMNERRLASIRQKVGILFQGAALFDSMTVAENVAFAFRRDRTLVGAGRVAECHKATTGAGLAQLPAAAEFDRGRSRRGWRWRRGRSFGWWLVGSASGERRERGDDQGRAYRSASAPPLRSEVSHWIQQSRNCLSKYT